MLFNSYEFLVFFPLAVMMYFLTPVKWRWLLLLTASCYFYMCWKPEYIVLMMFPSLIDYYVALKMRATPEQNKRKKYLWFSLVTNLGLLFTFKYFNFFNESLRALFEALNLSYAVPVVNLLLPVGISFYTFQTLSYTIDVYRGAVEPERHLGKFALFITFFPQLVAGPIERSRNLLSQLQNLRARFEAERITDGLRLMLWGFFKKVVIADRLAATVNLVYNSPAEYHGVQIVLATVFFAFQIFCDFSGYSDIAIGAAKIFGVNLMKNFDKPYSARSISEFWKRWHISLSTWFKDYVYIPLGGNRTIKWRWYYNLFITFLISGLWHGANWTFIIWGALHGIYLIFAIISRPYKDTLLQLLGLSKRPFALKALQVLTTFALVNLGWLFFRANNLSDALLLLHNLFVLAPLASVFEFITPGALALNLLLIAILELAHYVEKETPFILSLTRKPALIRWPAYVAVTLAILYLSSSSGHQFIYFQF
ncbi:MBOAT family protein [candidate division KSB1 bacterium]|nr:MBOAT family protein [candidate division KSB1 bacterium]